MRRLFKVFVSGLGVAAAWYGGYVATTYLRHGRDSHQSQTTRLLDVFMPDYEVRECHQVTVQAPSDVTFAAAREVSFHDSPLVRLIFALRELPLRLAGSPVAPLQHGPTLDEVVSLGWRQIGEVPGRQIVMGAVTQPWKQDVEFRGLPPEEFATFREPGYAKIAWTLEVDPVDSPLRGSSSLFRTETRVSTTDRISREKFRRYWSFLSPGIIIIRYEMLRLVKSEAERRAAVLTIPHLTNPQ